VVIESRKPANEPTMVTVFHLDGRRLMLTHYCSGGNHPRMTARASPGASLEFTTIDVANLRSPAEGHMQGLKIEFKPPHEIVQTWAWREKGKDTPGPAMLERQSPSSLP
jgi:hypothetical protein